MKKKRVFPVFLIIIVLGAAVVGAGIYFYPVWRSAVILRDTIDLSRFAYELEVDLDRDRLEEDQKKLLEGLAKLTGFEEDSMFNLTVRGSVWEDEIHVLIYPKESRNPLIELYLSSDMDVINETLPYNVIRRNLVARYGLLDHIMPAEKEAVYMTLEQAEQIFELDLKGLRDFGLPDIDDVQSVFGYFMLLAAMDREESGEGNCYESKMEQAWLRIEVSETDGTAPVKLYFEIQDPGAAALQREDLLSRLGIELPGEQLKILKSITAVVIPGAGDRMAVPEELMSQKKADLLAEIFDLIRKVTGFWK